MKNVHQDPSVFPGQKDESSRPFQVEQSPLTTADLAPGTDMVINLFPHVARRL